MNSYTDTTASTTLPPRPPSVARGITDPALILIKLSRWNTTTFPSSAAAMAATLDLVMELLAVRSAFVTQLDQKLMRVLQMRDADGCNLPPNTVVPLDQLFCYYVRATPYSVAASDAVQDVQVGNMAMRTTFVVGAYLGFRLRLQDGRCLGSLCAFDPEPRQFTPDQVAAMQLIARHLSTLLQYDAAIISHCRIPTLL